MRAQSAIFDTSTPDNCQPQDPFRSGADPGPAEGSCRDLLEALAEVIDPRKPRGIRHRLVSILALAAAAVIAGARSYVAAGQWAANAPAGVLGALAVRVHPRTGGFVVPSESTIRRTLQTCDGDQLDQVLGAWLYPRLPTEALLSVDGKTLRGARAGDGRAVHVLAAMLAGPRTVLAQREIPDKTNEITAFAPLLDGLDLTGMLVSADAMHTSENTPGSWSRTRKRTTYSPSKTTSPPCSPSSTHCPGPQHRSRTSKKTVDTAAPNAAPSKSYPPQRPSTSHTPRKPSSSNATSATCTTTPPPRSRSSA